MHSGIYPPAPVPSSHKGITCNGADQEDKKSACGIVPQGDYLHALARVFLALFVQGEQPAHSGALPLLGGTGTRGQKSACTEPPCSEFLVGVRRGVPHR